MDREKIDYTIAVSQIQELAKIDAHYMPLLANVSALLNDMLSDVNWVGFYIMKNDQLVLGPFQGKPACVHIKPGEGVCGTAVQDKKTIRVDDVHQSRVTSLVIPPPVQNWLFRCSTGTPM